MDLANWSDAVAVVTLIGLFVNIWISRQAMKTVRATEQFKVSAGFREKAIDHLRKGRKQMSQPFDLAGASEALESGEVADALKALRDEYLRAYDVYSELRYLFDDKKRAAIDQLRERADNLDGECWECLNTARASGATSVPEEYKILETNFLQAAKSFRSRLLAEIDAVMVAEADALAGRN